jgi:glutaredoxin
MADQITIVRNRRCRKSDVVVRFLEQEQIPHRVLYLGEQEEADRLAEQYHLKASPGIIINGQTVNPYHLVEKCHVKHPRQTKERFLKMLTVEEKQ